MRKSFALIQYPSLLCLFELFSSPRKSTVALIRRLPAFPVSSVLSSPKPLCLEENELALAFSLSMWLDYQFFTMGKCCKASCKIPLQGSIHRILLCRALPKESAGTCKLEFPHLSAEWGKFSSHLLRLPSQIQNLKVWIDLKSKNLYLNAKEYFQFSNHDDKCFICKGIRTHLQVE